MEKVKTTIYIDKEIRKKFRVLCLEEGVSASVKISRMIEEELKRKGEN